MTQENTPLWEAMHNAHMNVADIDGSTAEQCYAAELYVIADVIEQRGAKGLDVDPGETADWLGTEAARLEQGTSVTDQDLLQTTDASVWAAAFMRATRGSVDEETMLGWFANALTCGGNHQYWQSAEYKKMIADCLTNLDRVNVKESV